jgi:hypothetical protein
MIARINQAIAHSMLQRNAPLPSGLVGGRAGERVGAVPVIARDGERAITRQPLRPFLVSGGKRLLDQQPAETGAVDEQIASDNLPVGKNDALDETVLSSKLRVDDLALDPPNTVLFRILAKEASVEACVEVKCIADL